MSEIIDIMIGHQPTSLAEVQQLCEQMKDLRDERDRLARAIVWALGYTDFRAREPGEGPYWWRIELRLRAKLTGEQIDAILAALTPTGQRWTRGRQA